MFRPISHNYYRLFDDTYYTEYDEQGIKIKPSFSFYNTKHIYYNTETDNFDTIRQIINQNKSCKLTFSVIDSQNEAYGRGATEYAYDKIFKDFVDMHMVKSGLYFVDVNEDSFWDSENNIEIFVRLIAMTVASGGILPFHLSPKLLETISRKTMYAYEIEFFMKLVDLETFDRCEAMTETDFLDLDLGYDDKIEYYRARMSDNSEKKQLIYGTIAKCFELFDSMYNFDICTIDKVFSGQYLIDTAAVISCCVLLQVQYKDMWVKFISELNEIELRQMLYTFGNSYSLDKKYFIFVNRFISKDIVISTCTCTVTIHEKLFEDFDLLLQLKYYFVHENSISDGARIHGTNTNTIAMPNHIISGVGRSSLVQSILQQRRQLSLGTVISPVRRVEATDISLDTYNSSFWLSLFFPPPITYFDSELIRSNFSDIINRRSDIINRRTRIDVIIQNPSFALLGGPISNLQPMNIIHIDQSLLTGIANNLLQSLNRYTEIPIEDDSDSDILAYSRI